MSNTYTSLDRITPVTNLGILRRKEKSTHNSTSKKTDLINFQDCFLRPGAEPRPKNVICFISQKTVFYLGSIRNV